MDCALTGMVTNRMLDAVPCSSSATCYAITQPVALHNNTYLLTKDSGAWKQNNGTYLASHSNLNNQYVPSANIALNAIGYHNIINKYYTNIEEAYIDNLLGKDPSYFVYFVKNQNLFYFIWGEKYDITKNKNSANNFIYTGNVYYLQGNYRRNVYENTVYSIFKIETIE